MDIRCPENGEICVSWKVIGRIVLRAAVPITAGIYALSGPAAAESLPEALLKAYRTNPELTAARARLRAVDENIAIAKSAGRPQASGLVTVVQDFDRLGDIRDRGRTLDASASLSYPVYSGGRVLNSARAADARVMATRADLRALEGDLFAAVVGVYMDVLRDGYVLTLNINQVEILETEFASSKVRFASGDLTRTDLAQSEARLANARSQLVAAQGAATRSRESYRRLVGDWPQDLQPPPDLPALPLVPDDAVDVGLQDAPSLEAANAARMAAALDVRVARSSRSPQLSVSSSAGYTNYLGSADRVFGSTSGVPNDRSDARLGLTLSLPLYQGGRPAAQVRQANALEDEASEQIVGAERSVVANVRAAFSDQQVARSAIVANEAAVAANELALEGTRAESSVGSRLLIDVLNAQQELLISRVALVVSRRDAYVAGFNLLNAMGHADSRVLNLESSALYDPLPNYDRARRSISDYDDGRDEPTVATSTTGPTPVDIPAPQAFIPTETNVRSDAATLPRPSIETPLMSPER